LIADKAEVQARIDNIISEVEGNPSGLSQDWFFGAVDDCNQALMDIDGLIQNANALLESHPDDQSLQGLLKELSKAQTDIGSLMKDLNVVEIDSSITTEMQEIDDLLSASIFKLQSEIDSYNTEMHGADEERRLRSSLQILSDFSKVRRLYISAQRMFDGVMRSTSSQKFVTSEQSDLKETYQHIDDTFQQLGIVADELQSRLDQLESDLSKHLD